MEYLYLILNLGSISLPFLFSFHPKIKFYKLWKSLFIAITITMAIFIPWDVIFTVNGIWGFNDSYFLGTKILNLPIEEWLFFICIPYACVFTHYALLSYFPNMHLSSSLSKKTTLLFLFVLTLLTVLNYDNWYTVINFTLAIILTAIVYYKRPDILQEFYLTFLVMLIPFFIVNGILTGSFIENEVVWYNNAENLNIRLFTIPIEDTVYAFSMILMNLVIVKSLNKKALSN